MIKQRIRLIMLVLAVIFIFSWGTPLFSKPVLETPQSEEQEVITSNTFVEIAEKTQKFVVSIETTKTGPLGKKEQGIGSGTIIDKEGYILTNYHVIERAEKIIVKFDKTTCEAQIIGKDPATDLALIKIKPKSELTPAPLGDSDKIKVGQWVAAIGSPFGLTHTITCGIISGKERRLNYFVKFIQTSAQISPGNSGGPLVNLKGEVIGINTMILSKQGTWMGIGFAIPINTAKKILPALKKYGRVGWLGILLLDPKKMTELDRKRIREEKKISQIPTRGILVIEVILGSPADKAGLKKEDIISQFNGQDVKSAESFLEMIRKTEPGSLMEIKIKRGKEEIILKVKIEERKNIQISNLLTARVNFGSFCIKF